MESGELLSLEPGQVIPYGGHRFVPVSLELANEFSPGDHLVVVANSGELLRVPASVQRVASTAVGAASDAFAQMSAISDEAITNFFDAFAQRLADEIAFAPIKRANDADVARAQAKGRSVTRLVLSPMMRADMIAGLELWRDSPSSRNEVVGEVEHDGWSVQQRTAGLGVVGFVFEGRPNVFADACGVIRTGNTVVFRIGSDALGTAEAIVEHALAPALAAAGLPAGAASLVASPERSAGWALFSDTRLSLAVARGSGGAVAQLGAIAQQTGTPVSLHGTGGAWIVTGQSCDPERLAAVVTNSLDRKVCNTVNTVCVIEDRFEELAAAVIKGLQATSAEKGVNPKVHLVAGAEGGVPAEWFTEVVPIMRAEGAVSEPRAEMIDADQLGREWEWEESPEITLVKVASVEDAVGRFNTQSPRFAASLIADDEAEQTAFFNAIDAPFVGDGFTRWVDGQYALNQPELGLSNWQFGRLFARSGVLSGASVFTVRMKVTQLDPDLRR